MALPLFSGQIHITTFVNDYKTCLGLALSLSIFKKQPTLHIPQTFKEVPKKYNLSISYLKSNLKKNRNVFSRILGSTRYEISFRITMS